MPKVTFETADGTRLEVEARSGSSLMVAALVNGIDGIVAECGGCLACGTCHVYVQLSEPARLPPMTAEEDELLDAISGERRANSRLSCQISITEELEGLSVRLPATQG
jgi:2Fe-2S ferredoxin